MSHTVFLNASSRPRMPNGEAGEWASFWSDEKEELESKNGIPLLWWCLFNSNDIHKARLIDDGDIGSEDRDELYDDIGDKEITYPYLVTSQEKGLERLGRRREAVLAAIGRERAPMYDAFMDLIKRDFGPFILVRTSGLPDAPDAEPWLSGVVSEMDRLDLESSPGPELTGMAEELRRAPAVNAVWILGGTGRTDVWPTPELAPASKRKRVDDREWEGMEQTSTSRPARKRNRRVESLVEWLAAIVVGGSGLGAYFWTSSIIAAIAAFAVSSIIMGWAISRARR
jgi:hypothetical protein